MKIISHRGYWLSNDEKNSLDAFHRSFDLGLGTETDVRDFNRELVISHDMASGSELSLDDLLSLAEASKRKSTLTLALNIKADGLAHQLRSKLTGHSMLDCFVFDMSIPDMRSYLEVGIPVFTRMSEVETHPVWLERATGVWLDSFESDWFDVDLIKNLFFSGKRVCIVSPELHYRDEQAVWSKIKPISSDRRLILCTDYPEQALDFFQLRKV